MRKYMLCFVDYLWVPEPIFANNLTNEEFDIYVEIFCGGTHRIGQFYGDYESNTFRG